MIAGVSLQTFCGSFETHAPRDLSIPDLASATYSNRTFLPAGSPSAFVSATGESVYQHNQTDLEFL